MNSRNKLIARIIMGCMSAIVVGLVILFLVEMYAIGAVSYFTKHFLLGICLFCIGVIALLMPGVNQSKLSGENKGDSMMMVVGFLLIILSFFTIMLSFMTGLTG